MICDRSDPLRRFAILFTTTDNKQWQVYVKLTEGDNAKLVSIQRCHCTCEHTAASITDSHFFTALLFCTLRSGCWIAGSATHAAPTAAELAARRR